jgi:hypothetical protein
MKTLRCGCTGREIGGTRRAVTVQNGEIVELQASDVLCVPTLHGDVRVMTVAELAAELLDSDNARLEGDQGQES